MSLDLEQPASPLDSEPADTPETPQGESSVTSDASGLTQAQIDEIEEELDGVKIRGSKDKVEEIKSGRLMQADYTRKTQEVAEQRRAVEYERQQHHAAVQFQQQFLREVAQVTAIDERLQALQGANLQQINAEDPQRAQALLIEFNQLQAARGQLVGSLTQRQQQQALQAQHEYATRMQQGRAVLERDIKGWSPQLAQKLTEFGVTQGIPPEVLSSITDPAFVKVLHKAYLADQLEKQRAKPPEPPKPVSRLDGGSASNTKPLGEVTDPREWAERRRQRKSRNR